ncbi:MULTISPECIES: cation diffusion facilitator family transporter [Vibrio]|uniref:cation diffusion facilitator family transporter n=1 Tax=Vibrio TaxID=662 RepID=UPI001EFE4EA2|nr:MULTISPECIES: cation diffusion facilitator family transporter [Vibrio]MCG9677385.1 cation diffusion facilitator family transporter [Vibrio sp. Isolate24]USD35207.1 cation diffusion facilitator family transporter [Vibrio sp. SCSIO 43186]USD48273.1 cation diffusion facilitator family transporter [Vibrio sp. SCSIO 43145]USD72332.1 cation diffusion facilitator family transporter [Vibrio sp. SCSIO 43139]USD98008.1 cation transporter [Vibrio coralliilyticus]
MCARTSLNEKRILTFSALLASGFAVGGLVLGLLVGSLVIVFDGVYSSVSLLLTLLSLAVSKYIQSPSRSHFPFGKAVLEPVVIATKGSVILLIVAYSLYSAIIAVFNGGREVDASIATLFGVVNVLGCGYAWWHIAQKSKRFSSGLIEAEVKQWQMDTLLSVAVTLGFIAAWVVALSPLAEYSVYADPMMMILMSFYFIKVPYEMLKEAVRELLMMPPSDEICDAVDQGVSALVKEVKQQIELTAVTKVGRELRVNLDVHSTEKQVAIADIEKTRRILKDKLSKLPLDLRLNLHIAG